MNHMLIKWSIFLLILHATFTNIYADNNNEDFRPIPGVHGKIAKINPNNRNQVIIQGVPAYNWSFGCTPTSAAMLIGYYDRNGFPDMFVPDPPFNQIAPLTNQEWNTTYDNISSSDYYICPISATEQNVLGRTTRGHVNDYYRGVGDLTNDPYYGNWTEHSYTDGSRCIADYFGTSQKNHFNNQDGGTKSGLLYNGTKQYAQQINNYQSCWGTLGLAYYTSDIPTYQVTECYVQAREGHHQSLGLDITDGFTFDDFKTEINESRPVLMSLKSSGAGHAVLAFGYSTNNNHEIVYFYDTSDFQRHEMEWNGTYNYANYNFYIHAVTVFKISNPVSTEDEDYITINNDVLNFDQNTNQTFYSAFCDVNPETPTEYIVSWNWTLKAYHETGVFTINQGTTYGDNSSSWNVFIPFLSNSYNWLRDTNGRVKCDLLLTATDCNNSLYSTVKEIYINKEPSAPQILGVSQSNNTLNFNISDVGATGYYLYYDTDSGFPYSGTGALEGSSPIFFSAYDDIKVTGLAPNTNWNFCIKGINQIGEGPISQNYVQYVQYGNTISQNTQMSGNIILSHPLTLTNFATITISNNSTLILSDNGSLECLGGSALQIGNNVTIKGSKNTIIHDETSPVWTENGNSVVVRGTFSVGTNVKFTSNEADSWDGLYLYSNTSKNFNSIEFKNCNLYNENGSLNITNVTFNNSIISNKNANLNVLNSEINNGSIQNCNYGTNYLTSNITNTSVSGNGDGIYFSGRMNYLIDTCNISNNTGIGINVYQVTGLTSMIKNSNIYNNTGTGLRFYAAQGTVQSCSISQNQRGVMAYRGSIVEIKKDPVSQPWTDDSVITDNDYEELYFLNDCTITLDQNRNKIMDNDSYYLVMCPNSTYNRVFRNNYWGYTNALGASLPPSSRLYPSIIDPIPGQTGYLLSRVWNPGTPRSNEITQAQLIYQEGLSAKENNNDQNAEEKFKQVISEYPESEFIQSSAKQLIEVCDNKEDLKTYFENESNLHSNEIISRYADYLYNYCDLELGNYEEVITFFENIITNPPTEIDSILSRIDASYTYLLMSEQNNKSANFIGKLSDLKPMSNANFEKTKNDLLNLLTEKSISQQDSYYHNNNTPVLESVILNDNFPNPFNPSTTISFYLTEDSQTELNIFNIKGQKIKTLVNNHLTKGLHSILWDGKDDNKKQVASGLYLYRLKTPSCIQTKKMLMIK